jgi:hypothetical protein
VERGEYPPWDRLEVSHFMRFWTRPRIRNKTGAYIATATDVFFLKRHGSLEESPFYLGVDCYDTNSPIERLGVHAMSRDITTVLVRHPPY